ncbi:DUF1365 family protein [bacterium]|nr:DUF1365 family protein [bacterium]
MNSKIYVANVMHARLQPIQHGFIYPIYIYSIDLDELNTLDRDVAWFGYNKPRPVSIFDSDYLEEGNDPIKIKLLRYLNHHGCADGIERIEFVTSARFFNYVFNPVSFYYCYREDNTLRCAVAEVNNTFHERYLYILENPNSPPGQFPVHYIVPKDFYVSPFNKIEGDYDFHFHPLNGSMDIRLNILKEDKPVFKARMWGKSRPFTSGNLMKTIARYPIRAWLTMPRILWQAAKLYYHRRLPVIPKPNPDSTMTIRTAPPMLRERLYMAIVVSYLNKIQNGCLVMTLPDKSEHLFGDPSSLIKADINVKDYHFFRRVGKAGDIGFGEAYTAGDWDTTNLTNLLRLMIDNREAMNDHVVSWAKVGRVMNRIRHALQRNTRTGSRKNIHAHYDLSNDFFRNVLDPTMTYSCALFKEDGESLEQAQKNKLHVIIQKAEISAEDHVLEIGTGWGGFAIEAVKQTGCRVTSLTLSREQKQLAEERIREAGLQDRIEIQLRDYRDMEGSFDKIVSIEMIEAVGHEYLGAYFNALDRLLKPNGLAVIQAITLPDQRYDLYRKEGDWIQKYIFPGAVVPSFNALSNAMTRQSNFIVHNMENIGIHYSRTLAEWRKNLFDRRAEIEQLGFDDTFFRIWNYYLSYCEAGFATRTLYDIHLVLTRPNNKQLSS